MKNLKYKIQKRLTNLSRFMPLILLFSSLALQTSGLADEDKLKDLSKRLSITPPSQEDYAPILEAIEGQLAAIRLHNIERAYFFYASKEFRKATSFADFNRLIKANVVLLDNKSITLTSIQVNKDVATYEGVLTSSKGVTRKVRFELTQEDNEWKVLGLQLL